MDVPTVDSVPDDVPFTVRCVLVYARPVTVWLLVAFTVLMLLSRRVDVPVTVVFDATTFVVLSIFACASSCVGAIHTAFAGTRRKGVPRRRGHYYSLFIGSRKVPRATPEMPPPDSLEPAMTRLAARTTVLLLSAFVTLGVSAAVNVIAMRGFGAPDALVRGRYAKAPTLALQTAVAVERRTVCA